jgi:membrane-associated phospholipid phosphatase
VIRAEERLGAFLEPDLQRSVVGAGGALLHAVNWTYWLSQFAVVGLALLWIYLRRNGAYLRVRNTIIVANTIGLVIYIAAPTAPPRLFPELGFTDTLAQAEALNHGTSLVQLASNPYAAMPSLHTADALIIGVALAVVARHIVSTVLFAAWPAWVAFSLIASGNHFWLDIAAGAILAVVGAWAASAFEREPRVSNRSTVQRPPGRRQPHLRASYLDQDRCVAVGPADFVHRCDQRCYPSAAIRPKTDPALQQHSDRRGRIFPASTRQSKN